MSSSAAASSPSSLRQTPEPSPQASTCRRHHIDCHRHRIETFSDFTICFRRRKEYKGGPKSDAGKRLCCRPRGAPERAALAWRVQVHSVCKSCSRLTTGGAATDVKTPEAVTGSAECAKECPADAALLAVAPPLGPASPSKRPTDQEAAITQKYGGIRR